MIRIRFFRTGRKKQPFYKIVVTNTKNAPSGGRFIEDVGFYDPRTKECNIKEDRVKHWVSEGASLSDTVHNLLVRKQVVIGKKIPVHSISKKETPVEESASQKEAPVEKTEKAEEPTTEEVVTEDPQKETEEKTEASVAEEETVTEEPVADTKETTEKESTEDEKEKTEASVAEEETVTEELEEESGEENGKEKK